MFPVILVDFLVSHLNTIRSGLSITSCLHFVPSSDLSAGLLQLHLSVCETFAQNTLFYISLIVRTTKYRSVAPVFQYESLLFLHLELTATPPLPLIQLFFMFSSVLLMLLGIRTSVYGTVCTSANPVQITRIRQMIRKSCLCKKYISEVNSFFLFGNFDKDLLSDCYFSHYDLDFNTSESNWVSSISQIGTHAHLKGRLPTWAVGV